MSCGSNTNGCNDTTPTTSATGKKISQLPKMYQLSANDLFVVVDVEANGPTTADVTKSVDFGTIVYYDSSGTTYLNANTYQDAIDELDGIIGNLSGVTDAPDNNTYLRIDGDWVQSDVFVSADYYDINEVDNIITIYATSANLEAHITNFDNPHQVDKNDVGLSAVNNTSDLDKPISTLTQIALDTKVNTSVLVEYTTSADFDAHISTYDIHRVQDDTQTTSATLWSSSKTKEYVDNSVESKLDVSLSGTANGLATLDGGGTIPISQLPDAVLGALEFKGTWDATSNVPTLSDGSGTNNGEYYKVSVAGSTSLDGITDWEPGDWVINVETSASNKWEKIDQSELVVSVNSKTGAVVLDADDIDDTSTTHKFVDISFINNTNSHIADTNIHYPVSAIDGLVPNGGNVGQVLMKDTITDYDYSWHNLPGGGDMLKSTYDISENGIVDNSEQLGGQLPGYYATSADVLPLYGATEDRPSGVLPGTMYFTSGLGYPIWYDGTNWVNATGAFVIGPA